MPMKTARGFTLIEMIITLVIFILLCGAVFGLITVVLTTTSSLQDNQNRLDQVGALDAFLKKNLGNLPAASVLVSYRRGDGDGLTNTGVIAGQGADLIAIDAKLQDNGYYTLRVTSWSGDAMDAQNLPANANPFFTFENAVQNESASLTWRPLIHDVSHIDWKFQGAGTNEWVNQWPEAQQKPNLAELSIQLVGDLQPAVMDFWIPNITPAPLFIVMPGTH